eukprot:TRINITY_DN6377_c0_g1_i2.p1 TRINITY_DN6377_c0_g1~~TRINITY_DN6377_c0_g1_i2.p1  ORF type:complete len:109 (-),score=11.52 TRINITY_DN6377_c0_g1_i2:499-825(-)
MRNQIIRWAAGLTHSTELISGCSAHRLLYSCSTHNTGTPYFLREVEHPDCSTSYLLESKLRPVMLPTTDSSLLSVRAGGQSCIRQLVSFKFAGVRALPILPTWKAIDF